MRKGVFGGGSGCGGSCRCNGAGGGGSSFIHPAYSCLNPVYGTVSTASLNDGDYNAFGPQPNGVVAPSSFGTTNVGGKALKKAIYIYIYIAACIDLLKCKYAYIYIYRCRHS